MATLLKDSHITLWRQLKTILRDLALTELKPGDRIPTEQEICERYGVSRVTVRQAIGSLVDEGVLARQQGRGTFVLPPKIVEPLTEAHQLDLDEEQKAAPGLLVRTMSREEVPADRRLAAKLGVSPGEPIYKTRQQRLIDDEPSSMRVTYLPARICQGLLELDLASHSIYALLQASYGIRAVRVEETVECIVADRYRAAILAVSEGAPLILVEHLAYDENSAAVVFDRCFYRSDSYKLKRTIYR